MTQIDTRRHEEFRRSSDELRYWAPILLSLLTSILALGVIYGHLGGRLEMIEYRLFLIERNQNGGH